MISIPIPVFVIMISLMLWIIFRDDRPKKKKLLSASEDKTVTTFYPCNELEFYKEQSKLEEMQLSEFN
jgi:hypothetical protein